MEKQPKYRQEIQQMMFVAGETGEVSAETTTLVEDIVHQQVIELYSRATDLASRRGVRTVSTDDLIFLIRHDKAKVSRLKTFLAWKDVRRRARDDDKGPADGADFVAGDDVLVNVSGPIEASGNGMNVADAAAKKPKKQKIGLPWDINNLYPIEIPDWVGKGHHSGGGQGGPNEPFAADEEDDEEEEEQNFATRQRLRAADKRTQNMTREEYVFFSECRQASFTYRKNKRFREWAGFQYFPDSKPNEDVIDMFGFLTLDIVHRLTEEALRVKENEERSRKQTSEKEDSTDNNDNKATGDSEDPGNASTANTSKKRKREERGLFQPPEETRSPVEPRHIHEAFRRSQMTPNRTIMMLLHEGRPRRVPLQFI